jgi:hypothetical protein
MKSSSSFMTTFPVAPLGLVFDEGRILVHHAVPERCVVVDDKQAFFMCPPVCYFVG